MFHLACMEYSRAYLRSLWVSWLAQQDRESSWQTRQQRGPCSKPCNVDLQRQKRHQPAMMTNNLLNSGSNMLGLLLSQLNYQLIEGVFFISIWHDDSVIFGSHVGLHTLTVTWSSFVNVLTLNMKKNKKQSVACKKPFRIGVDLRLDRIPRRKWL